MNTLTVQDLLGCTVDFIRDAGHGKLSGATKCCKPAFFAVPFDETLLKEGVRVALAILN